MKNSCKNIQEKCCGIHFQILQMATWNKLWLVLLISVLHSHIWLARGRTLFFYIFLFSVEDLKSAWNLEMFYDFYWNFNHIRPISHSLGLHIVTINLIAIYHDNFFRITIFYHNNILSLNVKLFTKAMVIFSTYSIVCWLLKIKHGNIFNLTVWKTKV